MIMTFEEKKAILVNDGIKYLDDLVQDEVSKDATAINNEGFDAQLSFLLKRGWTVEEIKYQLDNG